jgi:hypothetical protein
VGWNLGNIAKNGSGSVTLRLRVPNAVPAGTVLLNEANFTGDMVVSSPSAWATLVTG